MLDPLTPDERSALMSRIRRANTKPELAVRRVAHLLGFRFRLHRRDLPGTPDVVFPRLRKVIFVHGCFWHQHPGCRKARPPASRTDYWIPKLCRNQARDHAAQQKLERDGWAVLVVWECETKSAAALAEILASFLSEAASSPIQSRDRDDGSMAASRNQIREGRRRSGKDQAS